MMRTPVSSSNLVSVGYDGRSSILEIEFKEGRVYQYLQVPSSVYDGLMAASSKGSYFHQSIRDVYSYNRIL